jgi:four helix bundle protein
MAFMFENLEVYRRSVDLADQVITVTRDAPRGFGFLTDQLNRAILSNSTNLAEGNGRFTKPDRRNFFIIARGSTQECVPLIDLAGRHGLIEPGEQEAMRNELEEIARMISGLIKGLDKRAT